MLEYTKDELRVIYQGLSRLTALGGYRPLTPAEAVSIGPVLVKTAEMINAARATLERGPRLLVWRINTAHSPTMNELTSWLQRTIWRPKKEKAVLSNQVAKLIVETPALDLTGGRRARWVRVTRFTAQPNRLDDTAPDQIGGKFPIDVLVKMGVLVDDSPTWLYREGVIAKTSRGNTHVLVELGEMADSAVELGAPEDGPAPAPDRKPSKMKQHLAEALGDALIATPKRGRGMNVGATKPRRLPFGGA